MRSWPPPLTCLDLPQFCPEYVSTSQSLPLCPFPTFLKNNTGKGLATKLCLVLWWSSEGVEGDHVLQAQEWEETGNIHWKTRSGVLGMCALGGLRQRPTCRKWTAAVWMYKPPQRSSLRGPAQAAASCGTVAGEELTSGVLLPHTHGVGFGSHIWYHPWVWPPQTLP